MSLSIVLQNYKYNIFVIDPILIKILLEKFLTRKKKCLMYNFIKLYIKNMSIYAYNFFPGIYTLSLFTFLFRYSLLLIKKNTIKDIFHLMTQVDTSIVLSLSFECQERWKAFVSICITKWKASNNKNNFFGRFITN